MFAKYAVVVTLDYNCAKKPFVMFCYKEMYSVYIRDK